MFIQKIEEYQEFADLGFCTKYRCRFTNHPDLIVLADTHGLLLKCVVCSYTYHIGVQEYSNILQKIKAAEFILKLREFNQRGD